jgi:uncharacterized delta-60 repeat protein
MKNFWGRVVSGILTEKGDNLHPAGNNVRCFDCATTRLFLQPFTQSLFSVFTRNRSNFVLLRRLPAVAITVLVLLSGLLAVTGRAQTNFMSAQVIYGTWGTVTNSNTGIVPSGNNPSIAGFPANAPLWYSWTAPQSGEVEMDTIGSFSSEVVTNDTFGYLVTNIVQTNLEVSIGGPTNYGTISYVGVQDVINQEVVTNDLPLDTVLAVFTGNSVSGLSQVAANDNLFPINNTPLTSETADIEQIIESDSGDYENTAPPVPVLPLAPANNQGTTIINEFIPPYYGPSHLRFNAVAGTTYYIAVDTKANSPFPFDGGLFPSTGVIALQWAYESSGVFRFATEDFDGFSRLPLYQAASTESAAPDGTLNDANSVVLSYYPYNAPGALVTVTRVAGSSGRCTVNYSTEDGTNLIGFGPMPPNDVPGVQGVDYAPVSGTLVFDDNEMSKTILVPILGANSRNGQVPINNIQNVYFGLVLSNAELDPDEFGDISQPRVDPTFSTAMVKILNQSADPYGPDLIPFIFTNTAITISNAFVNNMPTNEIVTNTLSITNVALCLAPTNVLFGFEKANYRVPEDVTSTNSPWTQVAIYVERFGTNGDAATLGYIINDEEGDDAALDNEDNILYPLQPGSDFAVPTPPEPSNVIIRGANSDFALALGTISFPAAGTPGGNFQEITFTVSNSVLTKFNKDFRIELYREAPTVNNRTVPWYAGEMAETTVTILFNDQHPPAGSVDELYNADFNSFMALPPTEVPNTTPSRDTTPGVSGVVYSLAVLQNNESLLAGDFVSYNGFLLNNGNPINNIVLVDTNGNLDSSFSPVTGANDAIKSVALTPPYEAAQYYIGGNFTAFNNQPQSYVARLNTGGSLDTSFSPSVNGPVESVVPQPDGKVLIGGAFTQVDGQQINCLARLNTDGSLDTSFNPGTILSGTVNALATLPGFYTNRVSNGTTNQDDVFLNVSPNAAGYVTVKYDFPATNEMQVLYGGNVIFDTGVVSNGINQFSVAFGPGTAPLDLRVNPVPSFFNVDATNWSYKATIVTNSDILVGGSFNVSGQGYANIARFTTNGLLDTTFSNVFSGADNTVYALGWQSDGDAVIGGAFTHFNQAPANYIADLNWDGSLDTTNFFIGSGADDIVWNISVQPDGTMYVGGQFSRLNGTHRLGFARLYPNGTVDTTFMDTAYNQFAGLKKIFADDVAAVYTSGIQSDSNILIGGDFNQVGGGQAYTNVCDSLDESLGIQNSFFDTNLWVEPKTRDGVRDRYSVARLIGGSTPGPGNIQFQFSAYAANKSGSLLTVGLVRTNGDLGPVSANFSVTPGLAQSGRDYSYDSTPPLDWVASQFTTHPSRERSDGLFGLGGSLEDPYGLFLTLADLPINNQSIATVSVINNSQTSGNLNAQFQLANPSGANEFYLGGENIPLGTALGASSVPFTVVDDTSPSGTFSFYNTNFIATNSPVSIPVVRSNGVFGIVTMRAWATNGTAINGTDYRGVTNFSLQFGTGNNVSSNSYSVTILANGLISTNFVGKTVNLSLTSLGGGSGNAAFGISNATLTLVNPNFQGYLTLSASNYVANESIGTVSFEVNRVAGSAGQVSVQYATANVTAQNGVNYVGSTNTLNWNSGDASPRIINVPIMNTATVGGSEQFSVRLFNPLNTGGSAPGLFYEANSPGSITNAIVTITNNDSYGTLEFSQPSYLVNASGGFATINVIRTGGTTGKVSVNYNTSPGSNTMAGVDYTPTSGVLVLTSNQLTASFNVQVTNTGVLITSNYFFNVSLSNPTNASLGVPTNALVNILSAAYNQPPGSSNGLFSANINGDVLALAYETNGQVLAGGDFTSVNGNPQNFIVRLNTDGTTDNGFSAGANGPVQTVVSQTDGNVLIGGTFSTADGLTRNNIARFMTNGFLDTTFNPGSGANGTVYAMAEAFINGARGIYVGGAFSAISSSPNNSIGTSFGLARLNNAGALDSSFNVGSGVDGTVFALAVYPTNSPLAGEILIGGSFVHYNGVIVNGFARLNPDGSLDTNFVAGIAATNGSVNAIAIQPDGNILVGGDFGAFNGVSAGNIIRLNTDGSTDTSFAANVAQGANNTVNGIVIQPDNRILVVGQFTDFNGVTRNGVTRLLATGATDPTINFGTGANGAVNAALVQTSTGIITLGGAFTTYDGAPAAHIIQIYGLSITGSGVFEFNTGNYVVTETGIVAPITILRTGGTAGPNPDGTGDVFVDFSTDTNLVAGTTNDTAIANVNYLPTSATVDFPAGESVETVNVPILDDVNDVSASQWTVTMRLANPTPPATLLGPQSQSNAVLTIQNVNTAVNFASSSTTVFENVPNGVANVDILREGNTNGTSLVQFFTTTNGTTGIPGTDYFSTNETITFNPGVSDVQAQVLIISNSALAKTVGMALTNLASTPFIFAPSNAVLTIENNIGPPGELFFGSTNYTFNESGGSAVVTVLRTNGFTGDVSANYSTLDGTAVAGVNYVTNNATIQIRPNTASGTITITFLTNNPPQVPVTFTIGLSAPAGGATLIPPTNTQVTIVDDQRTGVAFLNSTNTFLETNGTVTVPVERLGSTNSGFSVQYFTTNGTALAGTNYLANSGVLSFAPAQTFAGITLTLLNNADVTNLQFGVVLTAPSLGVQLGSPSNSVVVIQPSAAGVTFTSPTNSVFKNAGQIVVPVVCLNPGAEPAIISSNTVPLTVSYFTVTNGSAQAGVDFLPVSGTLVFSNNIVTNTITVPILNNSLITGLRTFSLVLSNAIPVPPAKLVAPSNQVITVIDSNSGLSFSTANYSILDSGVATITVIRTDNTNTVSTVQFGTENGGSAVPGTDYFPTNGTLTFTNGQTSATFGVTVIGSSGVQPTKTILLGLSSPTNGVLMAPSGATLSIFNNNGSFVVPAGVALVPGSPNTPPGGILQSNLAATLSFAFRLAGGTNVGNLVATLQNGSGVSTTPVAQSCGPLVLNGPSVSHQFTFTPVGTNGQTILATFALQDGVKNIGTNVFALTIGSTTMLFSNTNSIFISASPANFQSQIASPYPSIITVSNVGGVLVGTTVTVTNFTHTSPQAVGVLVVSPGEQDTLLMWGVGTPNVGMNNTTLTFSDAATNSLPSATTTQTPITNGVYKPTQDVNNVPIINFP